MLSAARARARGAQAQREKFAHFAVLPLRSKEEAAQLLQEQKTDSVIYTIDGPLLETTSEGVTSPVTNVTTGTSEVIDDEVLNLVQKCNRTGEFTFPNISDVPIYGEGYTITLPQSGKLVICARSKQYPSYFDLVSYDSTGNILQYNVRNNSLGTHSGDKITLDNLLVHDLQINLDNVTNDGIIIGALGYSNHELKKFGTACFIVKFPDGNTILIPLYNRDSAVGDNICQSTIYLRANDDSTITLVVLPLSQEFMTRNVNSHGITRPIVLDNLSGNTGQIRDQFFTNAKRYMTQVTEQIQENEGREAEMLRRLEIDDAPVDDAPDDDAPDAGASESKSHHEDTSGGGGAMAASDSSKTINLICNVNDPSPYLLFDLIVASVGGGLFDFKPESPPLNVGDLIAVSLQGLMIPIELKNAGLYPLAADCRLNPEGTTVLILKENSIPDFLRTQMHEHKMNWNSMLVILEIQNERQTPQQVMENVRANFLGWLGVNIVACFRLGETYYAYPSAGFGDFVPEPLEDVTDFVVNVLTGKISIPPTMPRVTFDAQRIAIGEDIILIEDFLKSLIGKSIPELKKMTFYLRRLSVMFNTGLAVQQTMWKRVVTKIIDMCVSEEQKKHTSLTDEIKGLASEIRSTHDAQLVKRYKELKAKQKEGPKKLRTFLEKMFLFNTGATSGKLKLKTGQVRRKEKIEKASRNAEKVTESFENFLEYLEENIGEDGITLILPINPTNFSEFLKGHNIPIFNIMQRRQLTHEQLDGMTGEVLLEIGQPLYNAHSDEANVSDEQSLVHSTIVIPGDSYADSSSGHLLVLFAPEFLAPRITADSVLRVNGAALAIDPNIAQFMEIMQISILKKPRCIEANRFDIPIGSPKAIRLMLNFYRQCLKHVLQSYNDRKIVATQKITDASLEDEFPKLLNRLLMCILALFGTGEMPFSPVSQLFCGDADSGLRARPNDSRQIHQKDLALLVLLTEHSDRFGIGGKNGLDIVEGLVWMLVRQFGKHFMGILTEAREALIKKQKKEAEDDSKAHQVWCLQNRSDNYREALSIIILRDGPLTREESTQIDIKLTKTPRIRSRWGHLLLSGATLDKFKMTQEQADKFRAEGGGKITYKSIAEEFWKTKLKEEPNPIDPTATEHDASGGDAEESKASDSVIEITSQRQQAVNKFNKLLSDARIRPGEHLVASIDITNGERLPGFVQAVHQMMNISGPTLQRMMNVLDMTVDTFYDSFVIPFMLYGDEDPGSRDVKIVETIMQRFHTAQESFHALETDDGAGGGAMEI